MKKEKMRKENNEWSCIVMLPCLLLLLSSCQKDNSNPETSAQAPVLTTATVSNITQISATGGGKITSDGGHAVTARGVCWSISNNPTINDNKTSDGNDTGTFVSQFTGLTHNTTYHARAYAITSADTAYGNEVSFTTISNTSGNTITDVEGNIYHTITIGTQTWMVENLRTTKYNDGTPIALITDNAAWINDSSGAYSWYNNDAATFGNVYGALYNWYAVNTGKLCPQGWHVPSDNDWTILSNFLGGEKVAGSKVKEAGNVHWNLGNSDADNSSGFTALPGGSRYYKDASFNRNGLDGYWWSSSANSSTDAWGRDLSFNDKYLYRNLPWDKHWGLSVRCVKD